MKDINAMEAHQNFHLDCYDYITKPKKYHFKNLGRPPKRPKYQLPSVTTQNKTKQMSKLTGERLNLFLKEYLVEDNPLITPENEKFSTTNLGDAQVFLKQAYQTIQVRKAKLLTATLNVGLWLNKCYALFEIGKIHNPDNPLIWSEWVKESIGKSQSYAAKYRNVARLFEPYKKFGNLDLSFDSIYVNRRNIKEMLQNHDISVQWK